MENFVQKVHSQISNLIEQNQSTHRASVVYEVAKNLPMYERNKAWLKSVELATEA